MRRLPPILFRSPALAAMAAMLAVTGLAWGLPVLNRPAVTDAA